ncbi:MAG: TonB-dependent receptor [Bacteroidetes bacterium]|nr:MAG: TonB-dependent receptor [Bacteroidota bacterium]
MWYRIAVCLLLGLSAAPGRVALAQASAALRGVVTSADDGLPLQGANVVLEGPGGAVAYAAATGPEGTYAIEGIEPGRYPVRVSFIGFSTHRDTLLLRPGVLTYDVRLRVGAQELSGLMVEAERGAARRQAGLQTIRPSELSRIPMPGPSGDIAAYLQTLPGVVSGGDRGGQLYIRGGTPTQNLVLVDGLPIVKPFHISGLFSAFPQELVEQADVYAGGHSAAYMGAISSVIDVALREGDMERFKGSASAGPFLLTAHAEGPIVRETSSFLTMVRYSVIEEAAGPLLGRDVPLRFYDMTGRYAVQTGNSVCSVTGLHTYDRGRLDNERDLELAWQNTTLGGRCFIYSDDLRRTLALSAGYMHYRNDAGPSGAPERSAGLAKTYVSVDREMEQGWGGVQFGFRADYATYTYTLDEKFIALEAEDQYTYTLQSYVALEGRVGRWLTVSPGLGSQFGGEFTHFTLEPRLRLALRPDGTDRQELSLAVGKYNQIAEGITDERDAGTVFTIWVPAGRKDPVAEARHGIVGYRRRFGRGLEASLEAYVKDMRNIPVPLWTPVARFNTRTTLANGLAYGADARVELEAGPLYLYAGYGWAKVTYEAASRDLGAWVRGTLVEYSPAHDLRHQVHAVTSLDLGGVTANLRWELGTGRPFTRVYGFDLLLDLVTLEDYPTTDAGTPLTLYDRPYGARLPAYHRLDVSVSRPVRLAEALTLDVQAGALNLYDRRNIFYFDVNTLRRVDQTPFLPYLSLRVRAE